MFTLGTATSIRMMTDSAWLRGGKLPRMKLTPTTQIAHVDGIWIETSAALRQCNIRTLQDLSLVNLATTPSEIHKDQLVILLEAAEVAGGG